MPRGRTPYGHRSLAERFWPKVNKDGPVQPHCPELGPCWLWTASCDRRGYGKLMHYDPAIGYRLKGAHHVAWYLTNGYWPRRHVLHRCDGGMIGCVRPEHLFEGDNALNHQDKCAKGRQARGEGHGRARLVREQVVEIITGNDPANVLAERLGVTAAHVNLIRRGRRWRHLHEELWNA